MAFPCLPTKPAPAEMLGILLIANLSSGMTFAYERRCIRSNFPSRMPLTIMSASVTFPYSLNVSVSCRNIVNNMLTFSDRHKEQSTDSNRWVTGRLPILRKRVHSGTRNLSNNVDTTALICDFFEEATLQLVKPDSLRPSTLHFLVKKSISLATKAALLNTRTKHSLCKAIAKSSTLFYSR